MLSFTLSGKHIQGRQITLIVASLIVYLIYFILFLISYSLQVSYTFMFISFHVHILCMYHILSYNLSYTVLYFYLHSYTFHIRYFFILSSVFHLFLVFFIFQFYELLHSMYYYIYHSYPIPISCLLSCSGYTPMLYYSFFTYCFIIYFLRRTCIVVIYFAFEFSL